jgi:hypothetical protein
MNKNGLFINSNRPFRFAKASKDYAQRISVTIHFGKLLFLAA